MELIDTWIARLRGKVLPRPRQSVLTFDRYEMMTATQALRFEELQSTSVNEKLNAAQQPSWYSLADACELLATDETTLLEAAADRRVTCFVYSRSGAANLQMPATLAADVPEFLALPAGNCRELANNGISDVHAVAMTDASGQVHRVTLKQPKRVNLQIVYIQHPLPDIGQLTAC